MHQAKTERLDVRASSAVKRLLQEAARSCHKNVSEFLLDARVTAASQALAERRHFVRTVASSGGVSGVYAGMKS